MTLLTHTDRSLIDEVHFILATRDTGYRSLEAAVGELVDNSIQAGATEIDVWAMRAENPDDGVEIGLVDNGQGMSSVELQQSLRFGGTKRFNDRSGSGRFGMGLPNSSLSQARRVSVISWREGYCLGTYLDLDEITNGVTREIPNPESQTLPLWAVPHARETGTLVWWQRCDRIHYRRASTITRRLHATLGRLFRHHIWGGVALKVNGSTIPPNDPLLCHPETEVGGAKSYGPTLTYPVDVGGAEHKISVRFTELPIAEWHDLSSDEKRQRGLVGGAGVSIVRGQREIDHGWYFMGGKRRENYDDWWRCEVRFPAALDEHFGVTHSKQGITPSPLINEVLSGELEGIARELNARARRAFQATKPSTSKATISASRLDKFLPPVLAVQPTHTRLKYKIEVAPSDDALFFSVVRRTDAILITINKRHPFYEHIYSRTQNDAERYRIECMIIAAARGTLASESSGTLSEFHAAWSDTLALLLGR